MNYISYNSSSMKNFACVLFAAPINLLVTHHVQPSSIHNHIVMVQENMFSKELYGSDFLPVKPVG